MNVLQITLVLFTLKMYLERISKWLCVCCIIIYFTQVSKTISDSCPISPSTVEIVDDCPDSEEKWRFAAARKNCTAYASQCDEPDRLKYHCVIDSFVNQTLEVCAYSRIIMLGRALITTAHFMTNKCKIIWVRRNIKRLQRENKMWSLCKTLWWTW